MATIKDVARLAGVSHGTVSNIINGSATVNAEAIKRVEAAIKALNFTPNDKARSMRLSKTRNIAVVLPSIADEIYEQIYTGIESVAREAGYAINLFTSSDSHDQEIGILGTISQLRADGILIVTSAPDRTELFEALRNANVKIVFIRRKPAELYGSSFIGYKERDAIYQATRSILESGRRCLAFMGDRANYSNESECREAFIQAHSDLGVSLDGRMILRADAGKENAFREASWCLQGGTVPEAMVCISMEHAMGALAAVNMLGDKSQTRVYAIASKSWIKRAIRCDIEELQMDYLSLGEEAARQLIGEFAGSAQPVQKELPIEETASRFQPSAGGSSRGKLRILMTDSAASYAARVLSPQFTKLTGIDVEIDTYAYNEIYTRSLNDYPEYDLMQVNVVWQDEMIRSGAICPLERLPGARKWVSACFPETVVHQYALNDNQICFMPFILDMQMLFYRKDLFEDMYIRRVFYEKHQRNLRVPQTWEEYNQIAAFFTRALNPISPVEYGSTAGGNAYYSLYEYIPRLMSFGGHILDEGERPVFQSSRNERALKNYCEVYHYANPEATRWNWAEQGKQFCNGDTALMTIYQSHFRDYLNHHKMKIGLKKMGFAKIPGAYNVRGGWSLGISSRCRRPEDALSWIQWLSDQAIPYNILGGSLPTRDTLSSVEMRRAYPWFSQSFCDMSKSRSMISSRTAWLNSYRFESLAAEPISRCVGGMSTPDQTLGEIQNLLVEEKRKYEEA